MKTISNFIVFEGADGSGTTTQLSLLGERLKSNEKIAFFPTFEPTDGKIGQLIRCALKKETRLEPQTLAFLFAADRNEHLFGKNGIVEHIAKGFLVASDRYVLSSLVYQGIECADALPCSLNSGFGAPEMTIYLDIDPKIALERMKNRSSLEIYEYLDFQVKVRERYKSQIEAYRAVGAKVEVIDASQSVEKVGEQVWKIVSAMPIFKVQ